MFQRTRKTLPMVITNLMSHICFRTMFEAVLRYFGTFWVLSIQTESNSNRIISVRRKNFDARRMARKNAMKNGIILFFMCGWSVNNNFVYMAFKWSFTVE